MKRLKKISIIFLMAMLLSSCGSVYEGSKAGYTQATSVNGVVFDMPDSFLSQATAVTSIAEDVDYSNGTFLYKNGIDKYLLFNIEGVVVAVEKGTSFNFRDADDKKAQITSTDVCEVWMNLIDNKFEYDEKSSGDTYKIIADVSADISITSNNYATCHGKFASIQTDDYECSMFVGVPSGTIKELTKEQKDIIEHITKSLTLNDVFFANTEQSEETTSEKETSKTEVSSETQTSSENTEVSTPTTEKETESDTETKQEEIIPPTENKDEGFSSLGTNQSESKGGYSDIYHMLKIGQKGYLTALSNDGKELAITNITINKLYTGEEAKNIIKDYCKTNKCLYEYSEAPAGYSWHVIEYTLDHHPDDLYVNIKIEGLDGEKLKFRGVAASSRTYDIFSYAIMTENGCEKLYCYYAVPNGCKEYMLECGTRFTDTKDTACYKIDKY